MNAMSGAAPLRARALTVTRGPLVVLDGIDLTVAEGDTIGLVGPNGVGKTTLLLALAGQIQPDRGTVERTPPTAVVGYLPQERHRDDETVTAYLHRRVGATDASAELDAATAALAAGDDGADSRYDTALTRWLALGVADLPSRLGEVWSELSLHPDLLDQSTSSLSGGEAARVGLAALLLSRFDVYLLDEPTNDLDLDGLAMLERWIGELRAGVVLVSHDRTFLARTVDSVVELDEFTHQATRFSGGWHAYLDERAAAERHAWERFEEYDAKRGDLAGRAQREREWATQGLSKARKSDERDKFIRHFKVNQTEQLAGKAARTEKAIERLDAVDKPRAAWQLRLDIPTAARSGDVVARLSGLMVANGDFTLGPIDLLIGAGERVALVGANGSGKTTLINTILGRTSPTSGTAQLGQSVIVGEIGQARDQLIATGDVTLLRAFQDVVNSGHRPGPGLDAGDARTLLAKFGLVADHVMRTPATLSPGERTRASLAVLMAGQVNLLVLDEPTNHLDLPAIEQLEVALDAFGGTVILVTHDRSLLERVNLTRRIELVSGRVASDESVSVTV